MADTILEFLREAAPHTAKYTFLGLILCAWSLGVAAAIQNFKWAYNGETSTDKIYHTIAGIGIILLVTFFTSLIFLK